MNREIKFRALDNNNNMVYVLPYFSPGKGVWSIVHSNGWVPTYNNPNEGESNVFTPIKVETLMQFTGLTDKNGKEIYEGDILPNSHGSNCVVVFEYGEFKAKSKDGFFIVPTFFWACEIIGNIYENDELL